VSERSNLDYTIIGVYRNTRLVCAHSVRATNPDEAMALAAAENRRSGNFCILGAVEGLLEITTPGNDAGYATNADDIVFRPGRPAPPSARAATAKRQGPGAPAP